MSIQTGQAIPDGQLTEFVQVESEGCSIGPRQFSVAEEAKGKTIALFAVPGAFTPTCSAQHLPGFIESHDELKGKGVDEIWCVAVNDPFVMGAWGREQKVSDKVRMLADGNGDWTKALGMEFDLTHRGLGVRSKRYSALIKDGRVEALHVDEGGGLEKSDAKTLLGDL